MQAPQLDVLLGQEGCYHAVLGHAEHIVLFAQECTVVGIVQAGEPDLPALAVLLHGAADLILVAQHGTAGRVLVEQDVAFCVDVLLHILMVIEVVGGDVGHHRDLRALVHADELEAGQLHHSHILRPDLGQHGQQGRTDVAAQMYFAACGLVELGDEGGGGGLAVRAGHGHDLAGAEIEEKLDLAGDHGARRHGILQGLFKVAHKAGGAHDDILALEAVQIVFAQAQVNAQFPDGSGIIAKLLHALFLVAQGHMGPQLHKLLDKSLVADTGTDERHLFAPDKFCKLLLIFLHKERTSSMKIQAEIDSLLHFTPFPANWQRQTLFWPRMHRNPI